jgi:hypothetical protein
MDTLMCEAYIPIQGTETTAEIDYTIKMKIHQTVQHKDVEYLHYGLVSMLGGSHVTTACTSSGCGWRRRPPDMEGSCEYKGGRPT